MKSLLNALQEGRLVELPDNDKEKSLRYLAHLIEAVPEMAGGVDMADEAISREAGRGYDLVILGVSRRPGDMLFFGNTAAVVLERSPTSILFVAS